MNRFHDHTHILFLILWKIRVYSYKRLAIVGDALYHNCILGECLSPRFSKKVIWYSTPITVTRSQESGYPCKSRRSKHNISISFIRVFPLSLNPDTGWCSLFYLPYFPIWNWTNSFSPRLRYYQDLNVWDTVNDLWETQGLITITELF